MVSSVSLVINHHDHMQLDVRGLFQFTACGHYPGKLAGTQAGTDRDHGETPVTGWVPWLALPALLEHSGLPAPGGGAPTVD